MTSVRPCAAAALLDKAPDLRAVFCSADALAEGVLTEARVRGLRVPRCGGQRQPLGASRRPGPRYARVRPGQGAAAAVISSQNSHEGRAGHPQRRPSLGIVKPMIRHARHRAA